MGQILMAPEESKQSGLLGRLRFRKDSETFLGDAAFQLPIIAERQK